MAERNYRRDDNIRQTGRYAYIDGSTVRKLQTRPVPEKRETERRQEQPRRRKRTSAKTRRNRARALQMQSPASDPSRVDATTAVSFGVLPPEVLQLYRQNHQAAAYPVRCVKE